MIENSKNYKPSPVFWGKCNYRVEYTWQIDSDGSRVTETVEVSAEDCQEAVDTVREKHGHLEDMRITRVWKDIHNSWWAVNAWH